MPTTSTQISRQKIQYPDLNHDGGASLHSKVQLMWETVADNSNSRIGAFTAVADSGTVELDHNFGSNLENISVLIFSGTGTTKTLILDYATAGYAVQEKAGSEKTVLQITAPGAGGPHTFTVTVIDGLLKPYQIHQLLASIPSNPSANTLVEWWDANGRGLTKTSTGVIGTTQTLSPVHTGAASVTAKPGFHYLIDTTSNPVTVTLPATIADYDRIKISDAKNNFNTNACTIARNGNNIDGAASDIVLNFAGDWMDLIGDNTASNWVTDTPTDGISAGGDSGTNYYDNGNFENDVTTGVSIDSGVGTVTEETTSPLEGARSAKITQGVGAAMVVDFAISGIDNWVIDGAIVPLSEAIIKLDAADADADANFGIWNDTDSTWLQGPVDLLGGGVINVVRELCSAAPVAGKTYVGRVTRVDNTSTREILVDRLRLDPLNGGAVVPEADEENVGLVKKHKYVTKSDATTYTASTIDLMQLTNLPIGFYRIVLQGELTKNAASTDCAAQMRLNNSPIPDATLGFDGANTVGRAFLSRTKYFSNLSASATFDIDLFISSASNAIANLSYTLEKIENMVDVGSDWD